MISYYIKRLIAAAVIVLTMTSCGIDAVSNPRVEEKISNAPRALWLECGYVESASHVGEVQYVLTAADLDQKGNFFTRGLIEVQGEPVSYEIYGLGVNQQAGPYSFTGTIAAFVNNISLVVDAIVINNHSSRTCGVNPERNEPGMLALDQKRIGMELKPGDVISVKLTSPTPFSRA